MLQPMWFLEPIIGAPKVWTWTCTSAKIACTWSLPGLFKLRPVFKQPLSVSFGRWHRNGPWWYWTTFQKSRVLRVMLFVFFWVDGHVHFQTSARTKWEEKNNYQKRRQGNAKKRSLGRAGHGGILFGSRTSLLKFDLFLETHKFPEISLDNP